jgi:hypothetical protein
MNTLQSIQKALIELRNHPDVGEPTFVEAATLLQMANDLAVVQGVSIEPVGTLCSPAQALATVSKYIASVPADTGYLTATALAKVLGCRRPTIMTHLRAGRIPAINISTNAKPNYRFCLESVKAALAAKPAAAKSTRKQAPTKPFLV